MRPEDETPFKTCGRCRQMWPDLAAVVHDPAMEVIGYQPAFEDPEAGLILYQHERPDCQSTLALPTRLLTAYRPDDLPVALLTGGPDCPRHCLDEGDLETCHLPCRMAWLRQVLQHLRRHELPAAEGETS